MPVFSLAFPGTLGNDCEIYRAVYIKKYCQHTWNAQSQIHSTIYSYGGIDKRTRSQAAWSCAAGVPQEQQGQNGHYCFCWAAAVKVFLRGDVSPRKPAGPTMGLLRSLSAILQMEIGKPHFRLLTWRVGDVAASAAASPISPCPLLLSPSFTLGLSYKAAILYTLMWD